MGCTCEGGGAAWIRYTHPLSPKTPTCATCVRQLVYSRYHGGAHCVCPPLSICVGPECSVGQVRVQGSLVSVGIALDLHAAVWQNVTACRCRIAGEKRGWLRVQPPRVSAWLRCLQLREEASPQGHGASATGTAAMVCVGGMRGKHRAQTNQESSSSSLSSSLSSSSSSRTDTHTLVQTKAYNYFVLLLFTGSLVPITRQEAS